MSATQQCPECGAAWPDEKICRNHFHQLLYWENEYPENAVVHNLLVVCYHLQHPSLYSPEGLTEAKNLLVEFVERGTSTTEIRRRNRSRLDSGNRQWKIKGTVQSYGAFENPVKWTMTAADVIAGGAENYCDNVREWAKLTLDTLRTSGNYCK